MSRSVTNGKGLPQTSINQEGSVILYLILGRLLNGAWILQALSLKRQEIRDTYWSAQTILPNGQKPCPWLTSGMWILRGLSVSQINFCESHIGGRSLSHKAITQGYWWPGMQKEAQEYVKKCDKCQRFAPNIHQLGGVLNPFSSPWSFAQWGLDIVGIFLNRQEIRDTYWLAQTILPNGSKPSPWLTSGM